MIEPDTHHLMVSKARRRLGAKNACAIILQNRRKHMLQYPLVGVVGNLHNEAGN